MSDYLSMQQSDLEALEELFGSEEEQLDLEAAGAEVGSFENPEDPQAIGSVIWTVRTYRRRC